MPLYAYRCKNCGYEFEERQRMMDDPLTDCPNCQEAQLRRVIDKVGVVFKGSGFYVTDTKSNNPAAPSTEKADKSSENGSSSDSSSSGESKSTSESTEKAPAAKKSTEKAPAAD